jgi:excisionase family DNA binding protein
MQDEFLTVDQIAERLKVPRGWIYGRTRDRSSNTIPHRKVGKYVRFIESEVRAWLDSQRRGWQPGQ